MISTLLLVGLLAAQGAALVHTHLDSGHDGPCAVCRVADDATHALDAAPSVVVALPAPTAPAIPPDAVDVRATARRAHPPRAPPIV